MTRAEIEKDIFEESHNLDYQFIPWSNKKVVNVVIRQVNAVIEQIANELSMSPRMAADMAREIRALKVQS